MSRVEKPLCEHNTAIATDLTLTSCPQRLSAKGGSAANAQPAVDRRARLLSAVKVFKRIVLEGEVLQVDSTVSAYGLATKVFKWRDDCVHHNVTPYNFICD